MKKHFLVFFLILSIGAFGQKAFKMPRDYYRVSKEEFKTGDTIRVTVYNRFDRPKQYWNYSEPCFFSVDKKRNPECSVDPPFVTLGVGDSAVFAFVIARPGVYRFQFFMANVIPVSEIRRWNCILRKWRVKP